VSDGAAYFEARDEVLAPLLDQEALVGLLRGLQSRGMLRVLMEPVALERMPATVRGSPELSAAVVDALRIHRVIEDVADGVQLTPSWRALMSDTAFSDPGDSLQTGRILGEALAGVGSGDYWSMPPEDRLTLARAVSPNPYAEGLVASFRADIAADPTRADLVTACRLLELGCGVAGRILTTLRAAPGLRAVGVELSPDLAAEARRRADDLGLADRFTVVCCDARDYTSEEPFDRVFWSQFFFPAGSRPGTLATIRRTLRSGGRAVAPVAGDAPSDALFRAMLASWGVPLLTPEALVAEVEAAGFIDAEIVGVDDPGPTAVRFRRR
jgi:hypothetical protein